MRSMDHRLSSGSVSETDCYRNGAMVPWTGEPAGLFDSGVVFPDLHTKRSYTDPTMG